MTRHTTMPAVSVIIPAFRRIDFVNQAVASVLRQTFTDYEIIVVDDASGEDIIRQYRLPDSARIVRRSTNSGGPALPRNDGSRVAQGRYLAFLDMDDIWLPDFLETQVAVLDARPEVGVAFCHYTNVDETLIPLTEQMHAIPPIADPLAQMISGCFLHSPSFALIRRTVFEAEGGFDGQFIGTSDWDLWIRLARRTQFHYDPSPRVLYRRYAAQLSAKRGLMFKANIAVLEKTLAWAAQDRPDLQPLIRRQLARWYNRYARTQMARGDNAQAIRESLSQALAYHPMSLHAYRLFSVLAGYTLKKRLFSRNPAVD